jgi:hypothetical protein
LTLLNCGLQIAIRNYAPTRPKRRGRRLHPRDLHALQDRLDLREELVRPVWFANGTGQTTGQHAIDPLLGLREETRTEEHNDAGMQSAQTLKRFFAIHERHRKIEQNQVKPMGPFSKLFEAFKTGLGGRDLKAGFRKNPKRQDSCGWLIVYDQNAPDAGRKNVPGSFGRFGVKEFVGFGFVLHFNAGPRKRRSLRPI